MVGQGPLLPPRPGFFGPRSLSGGDASAGRHTRAVRDRPERRAGRPGSMASASRMSRGASARRPDTPYLIGDVTSTFAAALLLQCVEQRRLDSRRTFQAIWPACSRSPRQRCGRCLSHAAPDGPKRLRLQPPTFTTQLTAVMEWCAPQPFRKEHRASPAGPARDDRLGARPGSEGPATRPCPEGLFEPQELDRYRQVLARMAASYKIGNRRRPERTEMPAMSLTASTGLVLDGPAILPSSTSRSIPACCCCRKTLDLAWTPATRKVGQRASNGSWMVRAVVQRRNGFVWQFGYIPNGYSSLLLKVPDRLRHPSSCSQTATG
jgi:hypothetical protein